MSVTAQESNQFLGATEDDVLALSPDLSRNAARAAVRGVHGNHHHERTSADIRRRWLDEQRSVAALIKDLGGRARRLAPCERDCLWYRADYTLSRLKLETAELWAAAIYAHGQRATALMDMAGGLEHLADALHCAMVGCAARFAVAKATDGDPFAWEPVRRVIDAPGGTVKFQ